MPHSRPAREPRFFEDTAPDVGRNVVQGSRAPDRPGARSRVGTERKFGQMPGEIARHKLEIIDGRACRDGKDHPPPHQPPRAQPAFMQWPHLQRREERRPRMVRIVVPPPYHRAPTVRGGISAAGASHSHSPPRRRQTVLTGRRGGIARWCGQPWYEGTRHSRPSLATATAPRLLAQDGASAAPHWRRPDHTADRSGRCPGARSYSGDSAQRCPLALVGAGGRPAGAVRSDAATRSVP